MTPVIDEFAITLCMALEASVAAFLEGQREERERIRRIMVSEVRKLPDGPCDALPLLSRIIERAFS